MGDEPDLLRVIARFCVDRARERQQAAEARGDARDAGRWRCEQRVLTEYFAMYEVSGVISYGEAVSYFRAKALQHRKHPAYRAEWHLPEADDPAIGMRSGWMGPG